MAHPPELDLDLIRVRAEQDNNGSPSEIARPSSPSADDVIVRADEIDETGGDRPQRPILRREGSAPPPPPRQPPPPAPPAQDDGQPSDSLSLAQLRNIVTNLPKLEPKAYAYSYHETRTLPEELEEWFQYTEEDRGLWEASKAAFQLAFKDFDLESDEQREEGMNWMTLPVELKKRFVSQQLQETKETHTESDGRSLLAIAYIAMGSWLELSDQARDEVSSKEVSELEPPNDKYRIASSQLKQIREAAGLLCEAGAVNILFGVIRTTCEQYVKFPLQTKSWLTPIKTSTESFHPI